MSDLDAYSNGYKDGNLAGLREAAEIARNHIWGDDVEWWLHATKTEVARRSAQECVDVILARIAELEKP